MRATHRGIIAAALWLGTAQVASAQNTPPSVLTVDAAVARVLAANRSIADAVDQSTRASSAVRVARSEFLPQLQPAVSWDNTTGSGGFSAGVNVTQKTPFGTSILAAPRLTRTTGGTEPSIDITLSQSLTRGLSTSYNLATLKRAQADMRDAQRNVSLVQRQVVMQAITGVYDAVRWEETVRLEQASYDRLKQYEEAAVLKQRIGLASGIDVYRAGISAKQAETALLASREGLQDALDSLSVLLNVPLGSVTRADGRFDEAPYRVSESDAVAAALSRRPEMQILREAREIAVLDASVARRRLLPELDVQARYTAGGSAAAAPAPAGAGTAPRFTVGVATSGNVFNYAERAAFENSQLSLQAVERAVSLQIDQLTLEVRYALRNQRRAEAAIGLREDEVRQVRGKLELAKVKFTHGMANNFDVIESESELRQAEVGLHGARIEYAVATWALKAVMGILLDDNGRLAR